MRTLVTIDDFSATRFYGAYLSETGYSQSDADNDPDFLAVLDEIPESNGVYWCNLYADGEELEAPDTDADFSVTYYADLDGETTGTLITDSDADSEIEIELIGETSIKNNHGRAIAKRLPTGMAFQGDSIKDGMIKGASTEFRRTELIFNNIAKLSNILYGDNIDNWLLTLNLSPDSEKELAIARKLTDKSGITPTDITNALHNAGFTDLYCYANKFQIDHTPTECGEAECGESECSPKIFFYSLDPREFENAMPFYTVGSECGEAECGYFVAGDIECGEMECGDEMPVVTRGADLLVNSLYNDVTEFGNWSSIPDNPKKWYKCFFISGDPVLTVVDVLESERRELRELLIERMPFKMYGLLFINYLRS